MNPYPVSVRTVLSERTFTFDDGQVLAVRRVRTYQMDGEDSARSFVELQFSADFCRQSEVARLKHTMELDGEHKRSILEALDSVDMACRYSLRGIRSSSEYTARAGDQLHVGYVTDATPKNFGLVIIVDDPAVGRATLKSFADNIVAEFQEILKGGHY